MRPELEGEVGFRWAHRERSTILFRRPELVEAIELSVAPLEGGARSVSGALDRRPLGTIELASGWQEIRWALPPGPPGPPGAPRVERLTLHWSGLGRASERDPRRLAARIRHVRFVEHVERGIVER